MADYEDYDNAAEDDLVEIDVNCLPDSEDLTGWVELRVSEEEPHNIKIWDSRSKENLVIPNGAEGNNYTAQLAIGELPAELWVEGCGYGADVLSLWYTPDGTWFPGNLNADIINVTTVLVNMSVDGVAESEEESVGGYVALGSDETELALHAVTAAGAPFDVDHRMTLDVEYGARGAGGRIEIWDYTEPAEPNQLSLPKRYYSAEKLPSDLRVKGTRVNVALRDITLIWKYSIQGRTIEDRIGVTVVGVDLDATPHSCEATEEVPGTPVMLNDDWDCELKYTASGDGHRELEPIWDNDYTAEEVTSEDDLMKVRLSVLPGALPGDAVLTLSNPDNVRLWPAATKGEPFDIITIPTEGKTYAISSLPQDLYVEGLELGQSVMTLTFDYLGVTYEDKLNVDIVTIEESQGGEREIIYNYNTDISFEVKPASLSSEYTYLWDLDGDGSFYNGDWEAGITRQESVKYSSDASGFGNVNLPQVPANKRKVYNVGVKLTDAAITVGFVLKKSTRVALDQRMGTSLAADITDSSECDAEVQTVCSGWNNSSPIAFDDTDDPAGHAPGNQTQSQIQFDFGDAPDYSLRILNDGNRILYSGWVAANGLCNAEVTSGGIRVYNAFVGMEPYLSDQTRENMVNIADHEATHCRQLEMARDNMPANNVWKLLDEYYEGVESDGFIDFAEDEAYFTAIEDGNLGWYDIYIYGQEAGDDGVVAVFDMDYRSSMLGPDERYPDMPEGSPVKNACRAYFQDMYDRIPFLEMKIEGYDHAMRPPE